MYGVFRANSRNVPMTSETKAVPRRDAGLTAYWVSEADSITASTMGWSQVTLVAKKLGVLAYLSSELSEDSYIDVGNELADEIAWAFAKMEDDCGFSGDGTSTYGGITGVRSALLNLSATRANIAGLFVGTGNLWSELVLADLNQVVGRLPQYADTSRAAWYVHKRFYHTVMERLSLAAGGVTAAEIAGGQREFRFMGYPVRIAQAMPGVEANDQVCAILGDLTLGTRFGDRRMTTIALSEHTAFTSDQLAIRGIERFDIVVHDVGNASATAASQVPGPIVGLLTAAS